MNPTQKPATGLELSPAEVLRCAALYVQRHGFHQGDMFADPTRPTSAACTQGAVKMAICGTPHATYTPEQATLFDHTIAVLAAHLDLYFGSDPLPWYLSRADAAEVVADWNDDNDRTGAQLVTVLHRAANEWDAFMGLIVARDAVSGGAL